MALEKKTLGSMSKEELRKIATDLKVDFLETDTNKTLEEKIVESGRYTSTKENSGGKVTVDKDGVKSHKTLGKYVKVRVIPTQAQNQKTSVFVSINLYTAEFHPNEIVSLPIKVVKFLKELGEAEHYYDPNFITENGNIGAHRTRMVPKYIVERIEDEEE